jgi:prophage antirepressor-like protein
MEVVVTIDGNPWFVGAELADVLYGRTTGLADVFARLDVNEKRVVTRADVIGLPLIGGTNAPRLRLISESGLYKLIMRSDKPEAKDFQNWVTKVVLPAIPQSFAEALRLAADQAASRASRRRTWLPGLGRTGPT